MERVLRLPVRQLPAPPHLLATAAALLPPADAATGAGSSQLALHLQNESSLPLPAPPALQGQDLMSRAPSGLASSQLVGLTDFEALASLQAPQQQQQQQPGGPVLEKIDSGLSTANTHAASAGNRSGGGGAQLPPSAAPAAAAPAPAPTTLSGRDSVALAGPSVGAAGRGGAEEEVSSEHAREGSDEEGGKGGAADCPPGSPTASEAALLRELMQQQEGDEEEGEGEGTAGAAAAAAATKRKRKAQAGGQAVLRKGGMPAVCPGCGAPPERGRQARRVPARSSAQERRDRWAGCCAPAACAPSSTCMHRLAAVMHRRALASPLRVLPCLACS